MLDVRYEKNQLIGVIKICPVAPIFIMASRILFIRQCEKGNEMRFEITRPKCIPTFVTLPQWISLLSFML